MKSRHELREAVFKILFQVENTELDFIELLGYTATFFVAASFLFKSIVSLRTVNCIGAILFVIYGLVKQTYPVALLNIFLVAVNLYQLWRLKQENQ